MNYLVRKYYLMKKRKCIEAIKFVTNEENVDIYNTAKGFIKYHKEFMNLDENKFINDPLVTLKMFYYKDLMYRKEELKNNNDDQMEEIIKIMNSDLKILDELTDDFINKYNKITHYIKYITFNKDFLSFAEQKEFLPKYYELIKNDSESFDKIKVRKVK